MKPARLRLFTLIRRALVWGVPLALLVALLVGFVDFTHSVRAMARPPSDIRADAIVAFTGGTRGRLEVGLQLLREGRGERLLISGVNQDLSDAALREGLKIESALATCCVDFGREALDTLGNATETAAWAQHHGYDHLIVVTDDYHMPRSFIELRLAMPNATLTPHPVKTHWAAMGHWLANPAAAARMAEEYAKFLVVASREMIVAMFQPESARP